MNTLIKSQPERLAAATAYANHYDGPAIGRIAKTAWLAGYQQADRDIEARHQELVAERRATAHFYEARDKQRLERIRQLTAEADELEREYDALLRRQGGDV